MIIPSEKKLLASANRAPSGPAPPAYSAYSANEFPPPSPRSGRACRPAVKLHQLPAHLLLIILYHTFPQTDAIDESKAERQRKTLYWLSNSTRLVCRAFYTACSHILRSTYLPAYDNMIRPPYSSDPFPLPSATDLSYSSSSSTPESPLDMLQRETHVFDLFIAVKVREDMWADDSAYHVEREESYKDLFDLNQPRARLEDLVRHYGIREGVIKLGGTASSSSPVLPASDFSPTGPVFRSTSEALPPRSQNALGKRPMRHRSRQLHFSTLSVSFSPRTVGVVLTTGRTKRTVVQVQRDSRNEKLEVTAQKLVRSLKAWLEQAG
ncbi:hypothetical protein DL96DRAFT_812368 [Flagelloscypha sp. PMI_526]|nr:hypothetical protein DL96DRAFT_812368 [Flagelloscypha sp. PMI_526]